MGSLYRMSINPKYYEQMDRAKIKKLLDNSYVLQCFNCYGEGAVEEGIFCIRPASNCCGGCMSYAECNVCSGTGELEALDDEMVDQFMMLRAIENTLSKFKEIRKTFKPEASESINTDYQLQELIKQERRYEQLSDAIYTEIKDAYRDEI
ncbi:MAG: hypothetical protein ACYTAN_17985 [Planctomycetota bacterium]|jgi:hypothetical protein